MTRHLQSAVPSLTEDDHQRGAQPIRVILYADYECPYCAKADALLGKLGVGYAFRHFPVVSKHPRASVLSCAAEAAAIQGRFWEMHDLLFSDQGHLDIPHIWDRARRLQLDVDRFESDRRSEFCDWRVKRDFESGVRAGVATTPTVVIDGSLHPGMPSSELLSKLG
jgi:protein-disulfide isomerase